MTRVDDAPVEAAERALMTASADLERGATRSAVTAAQGALDVLGTTAGRSADLLRVRSIRLLLVASEMWWRDAPDAAPFVGVRQLTDEAQRAAQRAGDPRALSVAACLRGKALIVVDNLERAVAALSEAVDLARAAGDRYVELEALTELGHHLVGRNLRRGLDLLHRAESLSRDDGTAPRLPEDRVIAATLRSRLTGLVGLAEFDSGVFDAAERRLQEAHDRLGVTGPPDKAGSAANYLAQLLTAAGRFEDAEAVLRQSVTMLDNDDGRLTVHLGYNLAQLGKLYLEWDRPADAAAPLHDGWHHVASSGHRSVLPLARNFLGELYLHPDGPTPDPERAAALFAESVEECRRSGFQRSEILGLALGARAAVANDRIAAALELSGRATERLTETDVMPALRTEEVYLIRYETLRAAGAAAAARPWLELAAATLETKAATIADPARRDQFRRRVPTSRAIVDACAADTGAHPA